MTMNVRAATPNDAKDIARIQVETWRSAYSGIISAQYLANLSLEGRAQYWESAILKAEEEKFLLVIEVDGTPRGFLAGGPLRSPIENYQGEVYALYIEASFQRKSLGEAIFKAGMLKLKEFGMKGILVWVLRDNPCFRFYEKMGGIKLAEEESKIGEEVHIEIGYGWPDR